MAPLLSKTDFIKDILLGIIRKTILQHNLECAASPTFSRKYSKISLENLEKRYITYNLAVKLYSEQLMSDSAAPLFCKLLCNFIEITLRHGCSPVNLLHTSRTLFTKNTPGRLLLNKVTGCRLLVL